MRSGLKLLCGLLSLVILLGACGKLPRPFQPLSNEERLSLPNIPFVNVEPVENIPEPMATDIAQSAAISLVKADIPAAVNKSPANALILNGFAHNTEKQGTIKPEYIHWVLSDADGTLLGDFHQPGANINRPTDSNESKPEDQALSEVADAVVKMLETPEDQIAAEAAVADEKMGLILNPVTGAPGDGNEALTRAMRKALLSADIPVGDDLDQTTFSLIGEVELEKNVARGQDRVRITWRVVDHQHDKIVGEASQANVVQAGSLDGRWGEVAGYAALAAVDGIRALHEKGKALNRRNARASIQAPQDDLSGQPEKVQPPTS